VTFRGRPARCVSDGPLLSAAASESHTMAHLLIVDDEQSICWGLAQLGRRLGHSVTTAATAEEGLKLARQQTPDVLVLDVRLPGMDGLTAMREFSALLGPVPVIVITAYGELQTAVEAIRGGAFDYLTKPFELAVARRAIQRALESRRTGAEATPRRAEPDEQRSLAGSSPAMQEVFKRIALVAASDACVHLRGESGTGKELAARAIHRYSRRSDGPFVPVHVASLSPSLAESELFGHVRGAFTGAEQARKGLLEQAHRGTVFLDEVAEIPPALQVKLLRALEYGELLPVGAERARQCDFRIISATHQDLSSRVAEGHFRHDLYFRLITFEIEMPPLRQRVEDIPELVEHFVGLLSADGHTPRARVSAETLAEMQRRPWHGNVRELRNALEHAMILARGGTIAPEHLPPPLPPAPGGRLAPEESIRSLLRRWAEEQMRRRSEADDLYQQWLALVEPPLLEVALKHSGAQCAAAARRLGLHRTTLRKKLDQWGIGETGD